MFKKVMMTAATIGMVCSMAMPVYAAPTVMADGGVFDDAYYTALYPDVVQVFGTDVNAHYQHYKNYGIKEGRIPYAPGTDVNAVITAAQAATPKKQLTAAQIAAQQQAQINHPSEAFVITRLACVPNVTGIKAVTEDHDPNGNLNKAGGYTSSVYFSYSLVDQSSYIIQVAMKQDIVDAGTDIGGCIETYATVKDAQARNTYLTAFDSIGALHVGSHVVLGTMVVRTSDFLTATQQAELTQNIMAAMMYVEQ